MKRIIYAFLILLQGGVVLSQSSSDSTISNFGFEKIGDTRSLPDQWFQMGSGYRISMDTLSKHTGKYSVLIQPLEKQPSKSFGYLGYQIPAAYAGSEIEVRAFMKLKDVKDGLIGLVLRVDGMSRVLQFDNMQRKNIHGTSDWASYSVKLPYPAEARKIFIGAMLTGSGQLWVDDFELLIDGQDISKAARKEIQVFPAEKDTVFDKGSEVPSFALTKEKIRDLALLAQVWGFLKYYHPAVSDGKYNWDAELFRILPRIISAGRPLERDRMLTEWIGHLGDFDTTKEAYDPGTSYKAPDLNWIHSSGFDSLLQSQLDKVRFAKRNTTHFYIAMVDGVENPEFLNEKAYSQIKYNDIGFRLLSLYRYWNMIEYFYPDKYLIGEDWKTVLKEFIPKYVQAGSELDYRLGVLELIARIHDTHANIWGDSTLDRHWGVRYAPLNLSFIENKAVVTGFYKKDKSQKDPVEPGDEIVSVNGKPVKELIKTRLKYTPASNYPTQLRGLARDLLRTNDSTIRITFSRNKIIKSKTLRTYLPLEIDLYKDKKSGDTCFRFVTPDIGYLYLGSIRSAYLPKLMNEVKNTKGLIIDLRCYPSDFVVFTLSQFLVPNRKSFVKFTKGSILYPGLFTLTEPIDVGNTTSEYYKGKVIILVNETTQSQAEYTTMALRVSPNSTVIGSTTAGADGNVSPIVLPGEIHTTISGIGVYYPDGTETQRVGIIPDIEFKPSIQGIKEGRDEVLEKAIEVIRGGAKRQPHNSLMPIKPRHR